MVRETSVQSQVESYQRLKTTVLDAALLNTRYYKVRIKGKVEPSRKWNGVVPSTTPLCGSYWKGWPEGSFFLKTKQSWQPISSSLVSAKLFWHVNCILMLNWIVRNWTVYLYVGYLMSNPNNLLALNDPERVDTP